MLIRRATAGDVAAISEVVTRAYQPYLERMETAPAPMLDDYAALVAAERAWVAVVDEQLVGAIIMWPKDDHLYVDNIAVDPEAHSRGVGSALLRQAETLAADSQRTAIRLYTNEIMVENIDYYPRRGFVETHRATENGYKRIYFERRL